MLQNSGNNFVVKGLSGFGKKREFVGLSLNFVPLGYVN